MKNAYLIIDVAQCNDCNNCFVACLDEHVANEWPPYTGSAPRHGHRWMNILRTERGQYPRIDVAFLPMPCQHCQDAPCIKAHPDCFTRRPDGIVLIDAIKAHARKELMGSCPYGAIYWNEDKQVCQKCTMCAHLLDNGDLKETRCSHSCHTGAIRYLLLEPAEMEKLVKEEGLENYRSELGTRPNVYYKNLHRFTKAFITGAILRNGDCAENVQVSLNGQGVNATQTTDYFGEFKFDALLPGVYRLEANGKQLAEVNLSSSVNLGEFTL